MRLTAILFFATILIASVGVYFVNERVGGSDDSGDDTYSRELRDAPAEPAPTTPRANPSVINVSGCIDSGGKCHCIDPQGRRIPVSQISQADCRKMLEIGPR